MNEEGVGDAPPAELPQVLENQHLRLPPSPRQHSPAWRQAKRSLPAPTPEETLTNPTKSHQELYKGLVATPLSRMQDLWRVIGEGLLKTSPIPGKIFLLSPLHPPPICPPSPTPA